MSHLFEAQGFLCNGFLPTDSDLLPGALVRTDELEHAAQIKEPRGMSCVSDTSAKEQGAERRARDKPCRTVIGKFAHARIVVHFSNLIQCRAVDAPAEERREGEYSMEVSTSEEEKLISAQLVLTIGQQSVGCPKVILRNAGLFVAQSRPTLSNQED